MKPICKYARWEVVNQRDDKDYVCRGNERYGCYCLYEECKGYKESDNDEPGSKDNSDSGSL